MTDSGELLTAADVRNVLFSKPPWGTRGYHEGEVDELVAQILARLEGRGTLTAQQVRDSRFHQPPMFKRGYRDEEVDDFLERAAQTLERLR